MSPDKTPCAAGPGTTGMVRAWSEDPLTARARSVWTAGDFLPIARSFVPGAEEFIARLARAGACVTGIDIAPNLIAQARLEARTAGCVVAIEVGDAEALRFVEDQFDTTVTPDVARPYQPDAGVLGSAEPARVGRGRRGLRAPRTRGHVIDLHQADPGASSRFHPRP